MNEHEEAGWLSALIDGELTGEERTRLEAHLTDCAPCRAELEALRKVKARLMAAPRRAMPPGLIADLEAGAGRASRPRSWMGAFPHARAPRWVPATAFLAVLAVGIWFGYFRRREAELPIEVLAAAHSRYSAEGLIPGDVVASNFSKELASYQNEN